MPIAARKANHGASCHVASQYDKVSSMTSVFYISFFSQNSVFNPHFRLLNLLKQYGGSEEEYMRFNTSTQNEQQLKNFDLSEYRQVIFSTVIVFHQQIIQQIQEIIKVHIVPAILDYDEMARGKQKGKFS